MARVDGYAPIGDYAIIGDCRCAALVSLDGSVDWLCWPRFDSPAFFGAMLDARAGGYCRIAPASPDFEATRQYRKGTAVLDTVFRTSSGAVRVTDLMPVGLDHDAILPDRQLIRVVEGLEGEVEMSFDYCPRPNFARGIPRLRDRGLLGVYCERAGRVAVMRSDIPMPLDREAGACRATTTITRGERHYLAIAYSDRSEVVLPVLGEWSDRQVDATVRWWTEWSQRCQYDGPWRDAVVRSAITLKLMCYAPSGAVVAAPTTSLPEKIGGVRNWDYRYCWIRDASLTLQALYDLGYPDEAEAFISWLLYTTRITRPRLEVLYNVYGSRHTIEHELPHLDGYAHSKPVRVGNLARNQLQLDVYGEALDAVFAFHRRRGSLDGSSRSMLRDWSRTIMDHWRDPDDGIWEKRTIRRQHTYSLVMCWLGLQRMCEFAEHGQLGRIDVSDCRMTQREIREFVEQRCINPALGCYVSEANGNDVDASLLLLARHGYVDPRNDVMVRTYQRIVERLGAKGLLRRYLADDGLSGGEGAFGICSFWAVSYLALAGRMAEATAMFEHLLECANDVGLFGEEIDPDTRAVLGNFPQAFTHVGLIDAALVMAQATAPTDPEQVRPATASPR